ncbi:MAG: LuxR family transcriptional regulator, partial [Rhizobacter sp.]|nr:LuxR family transcriptional regulator [Rhizobacter sp.]
MADSADMQTLESRLVRFANELGFGIIAGALILEGGPGRSSSFPFGNIPEPYRAVFEDNNRNRRDPVMQRLKRLSAPFVYDQSMYVNEDAGDIWEVQALFGFKTGIAMALHLPGGKHFLMGVDRDDPLPGDEGQLTRMMADLQLLAVHAQETTIRLLMPESVEMQYLPRLTERELEILKWTAEGKSAWAVGQILNIS